MSTASASQAAEVTENAAVHTTVYDLVFAIQEAADEESESEDEANALVCAALLGMREQIVPASEDDVSKAA
ncbi:MAG: hypothetical protein B7733_23745 [Myxococcales bacterium FL481]|nr:MAG: hypothetical protein B7733_23745 [Myxococcales bacterium FL481]